MTIAAAAIALGAPALADSFMPPSVQEYRSANGQVVVTVIPTMLSCAPGEADCTPAARAIVERVFGDYRGNSRTIRLLNVEAPNWVLVTDDGQRLLTVDDYASAGFGYNTLVVYDGEGAVIARHALTDILPEDYIAGLPRTAATLRWWGEAPRIEPGTRRAIISVLKPDRDGDMQRAMRDGGIEVTLNLDTGVIERPSGPEWENALNCARANSWLVSDAAAERERARYRRLCR
ncbi:hypothetical protein [Aurantiacibacter gangjinensis]|uniref:hypothetical protein n=1 Tax=Aurantiacibacter gangjinensis TaxID=502682 RepID=UPI0012E0AB7D|nr:hypothetical protein [Aurantiacibacter gangjinensis]